MDREERLFYKSFNLCVECHNPTNGKSLCELCSEKVNSYNRKWYADNRETIKINQNIRHRQMYKKRKEQGLCPKCGIKNNTGYSKCKACRDKEAEYKRLRLQVS